MANYTNLHSDNISINMDVNNNHIILGMQRDHLVTDAEMGGNNVTMNAAAATGTSSSWER
ncbi:MAG: hypothetical protein U5L96_15165 [Owenweeksia sp.]|nr:hypothetical protein [Owenweeksia sp.]